MRTADAAPLTAAEANALFSDLIHCPALLVAVSGGPDSTALMWLAARWRDALPSPPRLVAVTVDHGLRREAKAEAAAVAKLARQLKVAHRTLRWIGAKPATGLQQAARLARYRLLAQAARRAKATHILTAHTLDDQAETVLIRMSRGSGLAGLAAMVRTAPVPGDAALTLVRPLLGVPKARLIATLKAAKLPYADDPSNRDPRFTRARLRAVLPVLAAEGLDAARLSLLAQRLKRADAALESAADDAARAIARRTGWGGISVDAAGFAALPEEVALRLLGRTIAEIGDEGPVELAKLEALLAALARAQAAGAPFRRSLAGALVTLGKERIAVERAPPRRGKALTTHRPRPANRPGNR